MQDPQTIRSLKKATLADAIEIFTPTERESFGAHISRYLSRNEYSREVPKELKKFEEAISTIFFKGGKLADFGIQLKKSVPKNQFYTCLRCLLSSFEPQHEMKILTCTLFLAKHAELEG